MKLKKSDSRYLMHDISYNISTFYRGVCGKW